MRSLRPILSALGAVALFLMLATGTVKAVQTVVPPTPKLRGTIKDPSGALMAGVDIAILQGATVVKAGKTNPEGSFSFDLAAGAYKIAVAAPDFHTFTQDIRVTANMPSLSVTLSLEGMTAVVNVTESVEQPILDASLSLDATTISGDKITDLPDDEESLLAYLQSLAGGEGNAQLIIDGFEGGRIPTRDQIAQIIIEPNSFNANGTGPRITIVSKQPGPARWAGNMSYRYQDSALNARTSGTTNKPKNRRSQVDFSYNGPVIKGKLGMTFDLSKSQSDSGDNFIRAFTPAGPLNMAYTSPSTSDSLGFSQNWYLSKKHTLADNFYYSRNKNVNSGIGGFTLPERASDSKGHNWNFQLSDNLTISSKMTNTFQFRMSHSNNASVPRNIGVAINVLDAFNAGGGQNQSESRNASYNLNETLRWTPTAKWNFQFAFNANHQSSYNDSKSNYMGTFTFSSLADYLAERPLTFNQTFGNSVAQIKQSDANTSLQVTYRIKQAMSLSMGAQYTVQTHLKDYNNVSPTAQYQVQIKKRTIVSVGARLTYPTVGFSMGSYEQLLRGNGTTKQFSTVISNPTYPDPFLSGDSGTINGLATARQTRVEHLTSPYSINSQLSVNESLPKNWRVSTSFSVTRQVHQIRNRNINAPYPGTPLDPFLTPDEVNLLRPYYPFVGRINQFEPVGNALSKSLSFTINMPSTKKFLKTMLSGSFQYGLTWAADDNQAQNPYDFRSDWARNDQRHRFQSSFQVRPPRLGSYTFQISANSGRTYNITTGKDANLDQNINDRPAGVKRNSMIGPGSYNVNLSYSSPVLSFHKKKPEPAPAAGAAAPANSALDSLIQSATQAGLPASAIQQLIAQVSLQPGLLASAGAGSTSSTKPPTLLHPQTTLNVRISNLLNHPQSYGYSGVITSQLFGKSTGFQAGRTIALTLNSRF